MLAVRYSYGAMRLNRGWHWKILFQNTGPRVENLSQLPQLYKYLDCKANVIPGTASNSPTLQNEEKRGNGTGSKLNRYYYRKEVFMRNMRLEPGIIAADSTRQDQEVEISRILTESNETDKRKRRTRSLFLAKISPPKKKKRESIKPDEWKDFFFFRLFRKGIFCPFHQPTLRPADSKRKNNISKILWSRMKTQRTWNIYTIPPFTFYGSVFFVETFLRLRLQRAVSGTCGPSNKYLQDRVFDVESTIVTERERETQ